MEELGACPVCHEDCAYIETEGGWCVYVQCANCGTHTAHKPFANDREKAEAEKHVTQIWNMGKVIAEGRGE